MKNKELGKAKFRDRQIIKKNRKKKAYKVMFNEWQYGKKGIKRVRKCEYWKMGKKYA